MASDLNRCEFIGRLGRDPESRFSPDGAQIVNFSLAIGWKTKDKEGVEWVSVVAFGKLAEICAEYLSKGKQVYVSGRWNTQKWQDKETGADRYSTRIVADQMQMLGSKDDDGEQRQSSHNRYQKDSNPATRDSMNAQRPAAQPAGAMADMDDDIPFACHGPGAAWRCI